MLFCRNDKLRAGSALSHSTKSIMLEVSLRYLFSIFMALWSSTTSCEWVSGRIAALYSATNSLSCNMRICRSCSASFRVRWPIRISYAEMRALYFAIIRSSSADIAFCRRWCLLCNSSVLFGWISYKKREKTAFET